MPAKFPISLRTALLILAALACSVSAQIRLFGPKPTPQPMRKASDLIRRQEPVKINQSLLKEATPDNVHVVVSLPKQRAFLMIGDQIVIDSPISSGKRGHSSPTGNFSVLEKDPNHRSNIYGDFVDRSGRTVRAGVSAKIDAAPSGTHYVGASMKWFMRLTAEGVGMHIGILPDTPPRMAASGCRPMERNYFTITLK